MKAKLKSLVERRLEEEVNVRNPLKYLKDYPVEAYLDTVVSVVYLYTRVKKGNGAQSIYMAELVAAIGHGVRSKLKLRRDSGMAAKTGGFLLWNFEQLMMLRVKKGQGHKGHAAYIVEVLDDDAICEMWSDVGSSAVEKLPAEQPYDAWQGTRHATGQQMVKTGSKDVLDAISPETHPVLFDCLNRSQEVGWRVNEDVYRTHLWALRNKTEAFSDIWEQHNPESRATKMREAKAIGDVARRFLGKTFYHLYYYDFRGRKYPTTAYLHEQGSDLARGLLYRAERKPIGTEGFFWLLVSIASNWAGDAGRDDKLKTDKIPLKDRYDWCLDNEEILLSYAESPKVNQGWMHADKPWQFLAACVELMHLRVWQSRNGWENYNYESGLECYIDGSNNGSQHLAALTRDEETAPHVNLVPQDLPGDLYKYVADHVWARIKLEVDAYPPSDREACERFIDTLTEFKKAINLSEPKSDQRKLLVEEIRDFKLKNPRVADLSSPVYWLRITDAKQRRKIVKRNVMTLPYGGTPYGLGQQQIDDSKKHGIDELLYMEHKWGSYLGRVVFDDCRVSLRRPMQLLSVFENAGRAAEEAGEFLSWTVPVTKFPVVQYYTEGRVKKIWVQYGPPKGERLSTGYYVNTIQLAVCFIEDQVPSKGKQVSGASPNAIHSLDAAHLAITASRASFPVTTIHDSFGCHLCDMPELFRLIRETFVELHYAEPLGDIMEDIRGDISEVEFGNLDLSLVLDSEYCFV